MSNTKFTEGEWYLDGYQIKSTVCCLELAKVTVFNERKANATLMASSPLLYKALEDLLKELENLGFNSETVNALKLNSRKALASARGDL